MQQRTRSILDELAELSLTRNKEHLLDSRASNVITSAINLINYIKEHYDQNTAIELERRLLNSIRTQDPSKFSRGIKKAKPNDI